MRSNNHRFAFAGMGLMALAMLVSVLAFAPVEAFAADKVSHSDRIEQHIHDLHTKLMITQVEEPQWLKVAQVMRDDAHTMDALVSARAEHAKDMNAVDDLKSYGEIAQAHADGIKNLTPVFADLYASMTDSQKKAADNLFRHGNHKREHKVTKAQ